MNLKNFLYMSPDPRWLEILKASGWQTAAASLACTVMLFIAQRGLVVLEPWMATGLIMGLVLTGCLAAASAVETAIKTFPVHRWLMQWYAMRKAQRAVAEYIPFMTEEDRKIIAYLLARKQKSFNCASDGGYAGALISRGIVVHAMRSGYHYDPEQIPMIVPDHVWEVLDRHKETFPYRSEDDAEPHPWRVPWMVR